MISEHLHEEIVDMLRAKLSQYVDDHRLDKAAEDLYDFLWEYWKEDE